MRLKRVALIAVVALLAVWATGALVVNRLDPRALANTLVDTVVASTGRALTIGNASIKLWPRPVIMLEDVRFANAEWGTQPWLAQAKRVSAAVDIKRLFIGTLRIKYIELEDAHLALETNAAGVGNWKIARGGAASPPSLEALDIDAFSVDALNFSYRNGASGEMTEAKIEAAQITAAASPGVIHMTVLAKYNGKQVEATGTMGTLAGLIANQRGFPLDIEGKIGVAAVKIQGTIGEPHELNGIDLKLEAKVPEFADYIAQTGASVPKLGAFRGATRLTGSADTPVFSAIDIELGKADAMKLALRGGLNGTLSKDGTYAWRSDGLDFTLEGAQFGDLSQWYGRALPAWGTYRITGRIAGPAGSPGLYALDAVFGGNGRPEIKLRGAVRDFRTATGLDLAIAASAKDWWRPVLIDDAPPLPPFQARARVRDARNGYRVENLELRIAGNSVNASLNVISAGARPRVSGRLSSASIDLTRISRAPGPAKPVPAARAKPPATDRWKLADIDLELKIGRLALTDGRIVQSIAGKVALDDGRLKATAVELSAANAKVKLDGIIAEPQQLSGLDLNVSSQGTDLAELGKFLATELPAAGPFQARAHVRGALDALALSSIDASFGRPAQNLRVTGEIADARAWSGLKLAVAANVTDSVAAGRLFGIEAPRLPPLRIAAHVAGAPKALTLEELKLALGRSSLQGRATYTNADPRPRVSASLSGALADFSELPSLQPKTGSPNPLLVADIDAELKINRVVLPDRHALGPISGNLRIVAGAAELKQFAVALDGASATFDGKIGDPLKAAQLDLAFSAQLAHAGGLSAFTGLRLGDVPAFKATGRLADTAKGYALAAVKMTTAATALTGDLNIEQGPKRFKVTAKATSPMIDLSPLIPPPEDGTTKPSANARVIPDTALPVDVLRALDGDFDFKFESVRLGDAAPLGPLLVRATVADGVMKAEPIELTAKPGQSLSVAGTVDAAKSAWSLRVKANGIDFGEMLARFGRTGVVTGGATDLALDFEGQGKSLAALLGSLTGNAWIKVGPYKIHNFAVPLDRGTIIQMFGLANPFVKADPDTEVKCFVARVPIKNGVVSSDRKVATETAKYNAVLSGTLNLRTEQLDLSVTPVVRGEVKTVIRIRGTMASPVVDVNAVGAIAKSTASLGANIVTLGGWWMADTLLKKAAGDASPCATALAP